MTSSCCLHSKQLCQSLTVKIGCDCVENGYGRALNHIYLARAHTGRYSVVRVRPLSSPPFLSINCYARQCLDSAHPKPGIKRREAATGYVLDELKLPDRENEGREGGRGGTDEGNSGGKPRSASSDPDEEHRAGAGVRRRRRKPVLNVKIAICLNRYAGSTGAVLDVPVIRAEQCRKYARAGVGSDAISCAQEKTLAVDLDEPAHPRLGLKVTDHPDLASGWDVKHGCT